MTRILLLEDDTFSALALSALLEGEGFDVRCFSSSDIALEDAPREVPDILIADWSIEGSVTSVDVARRLKALNPNIRVFFVTGYESEEIKRQVEDLRPCMVFAKPLDFDQFIAQVRSPTSSSDDEEPEFERSTLLKGA